MKYIKYFEGSNESKISELILNEIKEIIYIIEDEGFLIKLEKSDWFDGGGGDIEILILTRQLNLEKYELLSRMSNLPKEEFYQEFLQRIEEIFEKYFKKNFHVLEFPNIQMPKTLDKKFTDEFIENWEWIIDICWKSPNNLADFHYLDY